MGERVDIRLGDYRLVERIGAGGMGEVYRARHELMGKTYAVKVLPARLAGQRGFVDRLRDEARVMAELRHPHIVQVHYMGSVGGQYFLAMDYVQGPEGKPLSLHAHLAGLADGRLSEPQALAWALQIAEALAYAHRRGVVHRDIKPANILIDREGNALLTDFGLAKAVGNEFLLSEIHESMKSLSDGRTIVGQRPAGDSLDIAATQSPDAARGRSSDASGILGTYDYMAPEQRGEFEGAIDERTDVYAFGVLLYRMLTARRPVGLAKPPSRAVPGLSGAWDAVVERCLEHDPADRYASGPALVEGLGDVAEDLRLRTGEPRQDGEERVPRPRVEPGRREEDAPPSTGADKDLTLDLGGGVTMELVLIPPGKFLMGSPETEKDRDSDEGPQREVTITKPFYMGATEVTQAQWRAVMGTTPWKGVLFAKDYAEEGADNAASCISWDDATEFCRKLLPKTGRTVRLPTEAQWEYACRAGSTTRFCYGDDASYSQLGEYSWYDKNAWDIGDRYAHPVGIKKANAWGLYDMHGNVWEWCSDWYVETYLPTGEAGANAKNAAPPGPVSGSSRVLRGGSFLNYGRRCRSADRYRLNPGNRGYSHGIRVVAVVGGVD